MSNHYETLGVTRTAPPEVIKAAYRALSQKWHPDKNKSMKAPMMMRELNNAWAVLSDAKARTAYDSELAEADARLHTFTRPQPARQQTQEKEQEWVSKPFAVDEALLKKGLAPRKSRDWILFLLSLIGIPILWIWLASMIG